VNKKQGHQPPIKLEISSFFGLEKLFFKLCPQELPNATAHSLPERIRKNSLCRKECDSMPFMGKLECVLFVRKLIVTFSATGAI